MGAHHPSLGRQPKAHSCRRRSARECLRYGERRVFIHSQRCDGIRARRALGVARRVPTKCLSTPAKILSLKIGVNSSSLRSYVLQICSMRSSGSSESHFVSPARLPSHSRTYACALPFLRDHLSRKEWPGLLARASVASAAAGGMCALMDKSAYVHDHTIVLGAPPRDDCRGVFAMHLWGGVDNGMITLVITSRPPFPSTGHSLGF